ncbi:hypothetical protein BTUL_0193g00010 [Botrytis tulipae]|uniref:FAD-binding PCMH-type domain-containing protein n=1 Tax=Botrytis tulipae TaxID=87230 RepID=A0A4Z1EBY9_9HELO|nr:hypothetical protein BTUL_0193g00010 [Botrytis tulipae]
MEISHRQVLHRFKPLIIIFIILISGPWLCASIILKSCRCFPGDLCWPSVSEWAAFNTSVNGRLISTIPIGSVCHEFFRNQSTYNVSKCTDLQAAWIDPQTHADTSHSVMAPFWANHSCDPFYPTKSQCVVGTYVQYAVNASCTSDYQATLAFATKRNLRLVVRNTGHDYFGKSSGDGALAIWTHHIRDFKFLDYTSKGYTGKAMVIGAGLQVLEATTLAHTQGLTIVGGATASVGISGGYTQGGGHGPLLSKYGFSADQVLEWEMIALDGRHMRASPYRNQALYWALSGGGGGTYGLVLSMTVRAYPEEVTTAANLTFTNQGVSQDLFYSSVAAFHSILPALTDAGGVAIWTLQTTGFNLAPATGPGMTKEKMDEIFAPVLQALTDLQISYSYTSVEFPNFYESTIAMNNPSETSIFQIGSRLLPRSGLTTNSSELIDALASICSYGAGISGLAFKAPSNSSFPNSVNPVLRSSMISFVVGTWWNRTDWEANLENQVLLTDTLLPLIEEFTPEGGSAYLNEGDIREKEWQRVFYGDNYKSLLSIKNEVDPKGLLWGRTAVGSESWAEDSNGRLCRVDI